MTVERYLTTDEKILAAAGNFYATNKRVINYWKNLMGEELHDLSYTHLTSISYISKSRMGLVDLGLIITVLGIVGVVVNIFLEERLVTPLCAAGAGVGVLIMLFGIFAKVTYVQFRGAGVSDTAGRRLRIRDVHSQEVKRLINLVREHTK
jgi:hypothetical protein